MKTYQMHISLKESASDMPVVMPELPSLVVIFLKVVCDGGNHINMKVKNSRSRKKNVLFQSLLYSSDEDCNTAISD